jgi:hypothetical protein
MSEPNLAPGRVFQKIDSKAEREELLEQAVDIHAATTIWTPSQKVVMQSYPVKFGEMEFEFHRPKSLLIADLEKALVEDHRKTCLFSLSSDRANLFFKASYIRYTAYELFFVRPKELYKVQRRMHYRLSIPETDRAFLQIDDPLFREGVRQRELHDISAGGASFKILADEAPLYSKGMQIAVLIQLAEHTIKAKAVVRNLINIPERLITQKGDPSIRVGIEFEELAEKHRKDIASFVLQRARKYLAKYL